MAATERDKGDGEMERGQSGRDTIISLRHGVDKNRLGGNRMEKIEPWRKMVLLLCIETA